MHFWTPLPLSMLLLVTLKIITKSITTLIRGKGGKCILTITMSELTRNTANVSILLQLLVSVVYRFDFRLWKQFCINVLGEHVNEKRMNCLLLCWQKGIPVGSRLRVKGVRKLFPFSGLGLSRNIGSINWVPTKYIFYGRNRAARVLFSRMARGWIINVITGIIFLYFSFLREWEWNIIKVTIL